jgi:cytoskeletal protein CcmA (bactofilin family)
MRQAKVSRSFPYFFRSESLMPDHPRRRLVDRANATPTLVGAGSRLEGELDCAGDLVVAGDVAGNAKVGGSLTLAQDGHWIGNVQTGNAVLCGILEGDIEVAERLEIRKTAKIRGTIRAKSIAIENGARVDGDMKVTSGKPVVQFEDRRKA